VTFFNAHTHKLPGDHEAALVNLDWPFNGSSTHQSYSAGIHPWHIQESNWQQQVATLRTIAHQKNIRAIGECGLDRMIEVSFKVQEQLFREQIHVAQELGKPLIIHCVRSFLEVLQCLQEERFTLPVLFHGFNNNAETARLILSAGHYLSFGKALFNPAMAPIFTSMPQNRFLLETDNSDYSIFQVYQQAALLRQSTLDQIQKSVQSLAQELFQIS
jgi:TatD DNase family protein